MNTAMFCPPRDQLGTKPRRSPADSGGLAAGILAVSDGENPALPPHRPDIPGEPDAPVEDETQPEPEKEKPKQQ